MTSLMSPRSRFVLAALLAGTAAFAVHAQQTPITGQMGAPSASANIPAAVPSSAPPSTPAPSNPAPSTAAPAPVADTADTATTTTDVGHTTRLLFAMQSQGTNAGRALPIPGQEASASYQRYLKSFAHPIPQFYETAVSKNSGISSSSSGTP